MIQKVILHNFQQHKHLEVEFKEGINALIGTSASGKSTVIRAITWVLFNRPGGDTVVSFSNRDLTEDMYVTLHLENHTITRKRNKKFNGYIVDGVEYGAVNRDVPQQVQEIVDMTLLNIHKQFDAHFLLDSSGGGIAQYLNSLINLEIIDTTLTNADKAQREWKADLLAVEAKRKEQEEFQKNHTWVTIAGQLLEEYAINEQERADNSALLTKIKALRDSYLLASNEKIQPIVTASKVLINEYNSILDEKKAALQQYNTIAELVNRYKETEKLFQLTPIVEKAKSLIADYNDIKQERLQVATKLQTILSLVTQYKETEKLFTLSACVKKAKSQIEDYKDIVAEKQEAVKKLEIITNLVKQYKDVTLLNESYSKELAILKAQLPLKCDKCGQYLGVNDACNV